MGAYIKGIEMPKVCADCPFRGVRYESVYYQYEKCKVLDKIFNECRLDINPYEQKLKDCPLIEVDLVRCGECIHRDDICDYCYEHERNIKDNDFCSYGKRRE